MFGLMRRAPRLSYCGTCKTMGAIYGHRTRALLNHDTVFLAELLQWHSGEPDWSNAYRSFNCLAMPRQADIPVALEFAAAATVMLAHFRIADHQVDSKQPLWHLAQRLLSPSYRRAVARLRKWHFPVDELVRVLTAQSDLEAEAESLSQVAEPTATATALFFSHGARVVGRADLAERMYRIGHLFGFLIYALDAYEDRIADARSGAFNPLLRFPKIDGRGEILRALHELELELPGEFAVRLRINVEERLGLRLRILSQRCRAGVRDRWTAAVKFARDMRERERGGAVKGMAIVASVSMLAFLAPH